MARVLTLLIIAPIMFLITIVSLAYLFPVIMGVIFDIVVFAFKVGLALVLIIVILALIGAGR